MKISEHKGFQVQVHQEGDSFFAEVYRKERLLKTIRDSEESGTSFRSSLAVLHAARERIDRAYPKVRIRYFGAI